MFSGALGSGGDTSLGDHWSTRGPSPELKPERVRGWANSTCSWASSCRQGLPPPRGDGSQGRRAPWTPSHTCLPPQASQPPCHRGSIWNSCPEHTSLPGVLWQDGDVTIKVEAGGTASGPSHAPAQRREGLQHEGQTLPPRPPPLAGPVVIPAGSYDPAVPRGTAPGGERGRAGSAGQARRKRTQLSRLWFLEWDVILGRNSGVRVGERGPGLGGNACSYTTSSQSGLSLLGVLWGAGAQTLMKTRVPSSLPLGQLIRLEKPRDWPRLWEEAALPPNSAVGRRPTMATTWRNHRRPLPRPGSTAPGPRRESARGSQERPGRPGSRGRRGEGCPGLLP